MPPNFSGHWIADLAKSKFVGPAPSALRTEINHHEPQLRQELAVTKPDGRQDRVAFSCITTGEENHCRVNGDAVRGHAHWVNDEIVIETWIAVGDSELYFCDCWLLLANGQQLVMEHRNDVIDGQRVVFTRA